MSTACGPDTAAGPAARSGGTGAARLPSAPPSRRSGAFIVLEGGEASGKSTQAARLAARLGARLTREPGGTELGESIRTLLLEPRVEPVDPHAELLLMVAARAQHVGVLLAPALARGEVVVSDRFTGSSLAYQGYGRGLPLEDVHAACLLATGGLEADLVILLEVPEQVAAERRQRTPDRIEAQDGAFHRRVREGFAELAASDPARWAVVDGTGSAEEVEQLVLAVVEARLGSTRVSPAPAEGEVR